MRLIDADKLKEEFPNDSDWDYPVNTNCYVCEMIDAQPTIELERKTGKWIELDSEEDRYDEIMCPHCRRVFTVDAYHWTDIGFTKSDLKFCPNCGAKMER